jgi:hypothetical protein
MWGWMRDSFRQSCKPDEWNVLSAIWILSCNDDNPIITYKGLELRLCLPPSYDVKSLVIERRELFRLRVSNVRFEVWKTEMQQGHSLPIWIKGIEEPDRRKLINDLTRDDVFTSQFRTEEHSERSSLDVIDWGLRHIESLRNAASARTAQKRANWQQFATIASLLIALATAGISGWGIKEQSILKQYEVTFLPKQSAYSDFMAAFDETAVAAFKHDEKATLLDLSRMESSYFKMQAFLDVKTGNVVFSKLNEFRTLCTKMVDSRSDVVTTEDDRKAYQQLNMELATLKYSFMNALYPALFTR